MGPGYALKFDIKHAGIAGIAFNVNTLLQQRWNTSMKWLGMASKEDLLDLYQRRKSLETTLEGRYSHHDARSALLNEDERQMGCC